MHDSHRNGRCDVIGIPDGLAVPLLADRRGDSARIAVGPTLTLVERVDGGGWVRGREHVAQGMCQTLDGPLRIATLPPARRRAMRSACHANDNLVSKTASLETQLKAANDNNAALEKRVEWLERKSARP
jgi:hypothetical protein